MGLPDRVSDLMPFDLLLSVARLGSVGLAGAEHGISQPAASTRIRRLERQLGVPLIERSPRGSRLTPDGELVAEWAQAAIDAAAALDAGVTSLRARSDAVLRVAASMTVAEYLLPGWLTTLRARDPGTAVALTAGNSTEVAAAVLDGTADIGFVEGPDLPPGLASHQVGADRLTVVVPPGHRWERRRSGITAAELAATPLVAREPGSGTRRYVEQALNSQAGLDRVPPVAQLSSTTAIKSAVAAGIGPAVLSSLAVAPELAAGALRAVKVTGLDLNRRLLAVWAEGRQLIGPAADLRAVAARAHDRGLRAPGAFVATGTSRSAAPRANIAVTRRPGAGERGEADADRVGERALGQSVGGARAGQDAERGADRADAGAGPHGRGHLVGVR